MISTTLGALLGIICILGVRTRLQPSPEPNATVYFIGAWYNRLIMGLIIGLVGEFHIFQDKYHIPESIIRGLFLGAIVSISFAFLQQAQTITYFIAGIGYGIIVDLITTLIIKKLVDKKKIS